MTTRRDLKSIIRERQRKTGESYTAARVHVMRDRAQLLGIQDVPQVAELRPIVDAAVLKVGIGSTARIQIIGEREQVTLRSRDVFALAPGHVVTLRIEKRWRHRGDA